MEKERLIYLLEQYAESTDSPDERAELQRFLDEEENRELFSDVLAGLMARHKDPAFDGLPYAHLSENVLRIDKSGNTLLAEKSPSKTRFFRKWSWAAAIVLLILSAGGYLVLNQKAGRQLATGSNETDIKAPQSSHAMITLANGNIVYLDSLGNGQPVQQGNVKLVKSATGQIAYQTATGQFLEQSQYNTLTNPQGSKVVDLQLADGSHVWLNVGSSLTYPVAFNGSERRVELKGEGYFEVAKDEAKKFIVSSNGVTTEILGTHFNVNAYSNEPAIKITLLEGSLRTASSTGSVIIKPGQQAVAQNGNVTVNRSPNLDQVMAWKNGYFSFDGLTLKQAMTQLERWYDIDVLYKGHVEDIELVGRMTRDIPLNGVMEILEKLGIHYQLEGRTLTIKQ